MGAERKELLLDDDDDFASLKAPDGVGSEEYGQIYFSIWQGLPRSFGCRAVRLMLIRASERTNPEFQRRTKNSDFRISRRGEEKKRLLWLAPRMQKL